MTLGGVAACVCAGGGLTAAGGGIVAAIAARAEAAAGRRALRVAQARETAQLDAMRGLAGAVRVAGSAVRVSASAVRAVICTHARIIAPHCDAVLLYDERDGALVCVHADGDAVRYFPGSRLSLEDGASLAVRARALGHRALLRDGGEAPHPTAADAIALPLVLGGGRTCVFVVCATAPIDAETQSRLAALADHAAAAYDLARDREDDRRRAEYDGLTGLLTPHAFRSQFAQRIGIGRAAASARGALLFVDTDHFKRWNDLYGHAAGDALLRRIAQTLRAAARPGDLVARNGGDEFCLVFDGSGKADAIARADDLRRAIGGLDFAALRPSASSAASVVTASVGVAAYPADGTDAAALLERADAAMYHTKRTGRDGTSFLGRDGTLTRLAEVVAAAHVR